MQIRLKNIGGIVDMGNGEIEISIPTKELTAEQHHMLQELFPHSQIQVDHLLNRESLIESIVENPIIDSSRAVHVIYENPGVWKKHIQSVESASVAKRK